MSQYKGKKVTVPMSAEAIAAKFDDLTLFGDKINNLPEEQRKQIGDVVFDRDAIKIKNPAVGEIVFKLIEHDPKRIAFKAEGMLPMMLIVDLESVDVNRTDVTTTIDIELPAMLRPFLGSKLQQVADHFGDFFGKLSAAN